MVLNTSIDYLLLLIVGYIPFLYIENIIIGIKTNTIEYIKLYVVLLSFIKLPFLILNFFIYLSPSL